MKNNKKIIHRLLISFCGTGITADHFKEQEIVTSLYKQVKEKEKAAIFDGPGSAQPQIFNINKTIISLLALAVSSTTLAIPATWPIGLTLFGALVDNFQAWGTSSISGTYGKNNLFENSQSAVEFVRNYKANNQLEDDEIEIMTTGYSRGAVTCNLFANDMVKAGLGNIDIDSVQLDPVPGPCNFLPEVTKLGKNVKTLTIFAAELDRTELFTMLRPATHPETQVTVLSTKTNHILVSNQERDLVHLTSKENKDHKIGLFLKTVTHQMAYLLGAPVAPLDKIPEELKDYQHPQPSDYKKIEAGSLNPFSSMRKSTRFVSDYEKDSSGKEMTIESAGYSEISEDAHQNLSKITPDVENARGYMDILRGLGANKEFIKSYNDFLYKTISRVIQCKKDQIDNLILELKQFNKAVSKVVDWSKTILESDRINTNSDNIKPYFSRLSADQIKNDFKYYDSISSSILQLRGRNKIKKAHSLSARAKRLFEEALNESEKILSTANPSNESDKLKIMIIDGIIKYLIDGVTKGKWTALGTGISQSLDLLKAIKTQDSRGEIINNFQKFIKKGSERCHFMAEAVAICAKRPLIPTTSSQFSFWNSQKSQQRQDLEHAKISASLRFEIRSEGSPSLG